jgi:hypothetical protein
LNFGIIGDEMHQCSNDLEHISRIYLYSIILSVLSFFLVLLPLYGLIENWLGFTIPIWIETPSIIGLYHFFLNIFEKFLWRYNFIRWLGLPKIPNLNGKWSAVIKTSYDKSEKNAAAVIVQSYSKISMVLKTDESTSKTTMAHFELSNPIHRTFTYSYLCKPLPTSAESMNIHEGTGNLEILEGDRELKGYYYSGRGRQNFGDIFLKKEETK